MEYRHFSGFDMHSNFENLAGHVQRAIETQANIDLEAYKQSQYNKKRVDSEDKEVELFNKICDEYANSSELKLKKLVILESRALYFYSLTEDRMNFYESQAMEMAKKMDESVVSGRNNRVKNCFQR